MLTWFLNIHRYHYLSHYLIFRRGYKDNAMDIIESLMAKYGSEAEDSGLGGI